MSAERRTWFDRIVGMHGYEGCNCVYLVDGFATCGATDWLSRATNTYVTYQTDPGHSPSNIVGMISTEEVVCAFYDDGTVSCGTPPSSCTPVTDFNTARTPYAYALAAGQTPADIVGMCADEENDNVYVWYRNGMASGGTTDNLVSVREPYPYDLPGGYDPSLIAEIVCDGSFNCAFYTDGNVSCGTTVQLDSARGLYPSQF